MTDLVPIQFFPFFWNYFLKIPSTNHQDRLLKNKIKLQNSSEKIKLISKQRSTRKKILFLQGGGREGWNQIKREMLQPRNGSSWAGLTRPWRATCWSKSHPPPPCKEDSQSQCSVHKLPWCPSVSWATKAVKHSRLQFVWIPLNGTWDETPEEKISTLKILERSWGTLNTWLQVMLRDQYIRCFSVFLWYKIYRQEASCMANTLLLQ